MTTRFVADGEGLIGFRLLNEVAADPADDISTHDPRTHHIPSDRTDRPRCQQGGCRSIDCGDALRSSPRSERSMDDRGLR